MIEVGGNIDELSAALCIYGRDLDPEVISRCLSAQPTSAHRKGDRKAAGQMPFDQGAWILAKRGEAPVGPDELTASLLNDLPVDAAVWETLSEDYDVQLRFGLHMESWNRGFHFSRETVERICRIRASIGFDIYAYGDDEDTEVKP